MIGKWPKISKFPIYPHYGGTKQPMIVPVKGVIVHSQYQKKINEKAWSHVWHVWDPPKPLYNIQRVKLIDSSALLLSFSALGIPVRTLTLDRSQPCRPSKVQAKKP